MGARSARLSLCYVVVLILGDLAKTLSPPWKGFGMAPMIIMIPHGWPQGTLAPVITILGAILFAICRIVFTYLSLSLQIR